MVRWIRIFNFSTREIETILLLNLKLNAMKNLYTSIRLTDIWVFNDNGN